MTTWRDRSIASAPFAAATAHALAGAGIQTIGQIDDLRAVMHRVPGLTDGQHHRIAAIVAECRDDDIRRRFPPFGAAA